VIAHWDDVEPERADNAALGFDRYDLGEAAGTDTVGLTRARVHPEKQSSPFHVEVDEEEIFFVLGGNGFLRQGDETFDVRAGDCIVHRVAEEPHTLVAGDDGLDVLAFGERTDPTITWLPRPSIVRNGVSFHVPAQAHPWDAEAEHGRIDLAAPSPRPANVLNLADAEDDDGWRELGGAAGSVRSGLNHQRVQPGNLNCPPHCHSLEEEIFVVLEGDGFLELTPSPSRADHGVSPERHAVRAGHVVSRRASSRVAHAFRGGDHGMTLLAYGTRRANDITWYPRSNKVFFRGIGVIARLEHIAYEVGEESPF
jgi:uncharacterized cupin superfamily protein